MFVALTDDRVVLIFGDRETAQAIQGFIPGCADPKLLDVGIPDVRTSECRGAKKKSRKKTLDLVDQQQHAAARSQLHRRRKRILLNQDQAVQYDDFSFRFWPHRSADKTIEEVFDWETVLNLFQMYATQRAISSKDANFMFREGFFFDRQNHLLANNIKSTKLAILDIDNVAGDVQALSDFLKCKKISHLVASTFSCINGGDYSTRQVKVRVLIPLSEAVDAENYKRIVRLLNEDFRQKFPIGVAGSQFPLDPACMSINNRFYAPCRPAKGDPIFIDGTYYIQDATRFSKRQPAFLDVRRYIIRNLPEDLEAPRIKRHVTGSIKKAAIDIVLQCAAAAGAGNGDGPFYNAAVELIKAGYSLEEAICALEGKEHMFGSGKGRSAKRAVNHVLRKQHSGSVTDERSVNWF